MEFLCTKCLNLVETDPCPVCGGSGADLREPRPEDECYLCTQVNRYGAMLAGALDRVGIPFRMMTSAHKTSMTRRFYVPYGEFDRAVEVIRDAFEEPEPMSDDVFASDPNLFSGEEIDNMEMADLDRLSLEELNVYLNKVNRTMKELRNQERKWKERNIRLMDMREEIENLLEER